MDSLYRSDLGHRIAAERHAFADAAITPLDHQLATRAAQCRFCSFGCLGLGGVNAGRATSAFAPDLPAAVHRQHVDASSTLGHRRLGDVVASHRSNLITSGGWWHTMGRTRAGAFPQTS